MLKLLTLLLTTLTLTPAYRISVNQIPNNGSVNSYNYLAFIYPYQVLEIIDPDVGLPEYLFLRIPATLSSSLEARKLLEKLPQNITILKQSENEKISFEKLSRQQFCLVSQLIPEEEMPKHINVSEGENKTLKERISESVQEIRNGVKDLNKKVQDIEKKVEENAFEDFLQLKSDRETSTKSVSLLTINVNNFIVLMEMSQETIIADPEGSIITGKVIVNLPDNTKFDIQNNGSTFRVAYLKESQFRSFFADNVGLIKKEDTFNMTLLDYGFDSNHRVSYYKMAASTDLFQGPIVWMKIFPVDLGSFYLAILDQKQKLFLLETRLNKLDLVGTINIEVHSSSIFIDIFTHKVRHSRGQIFVSFLGVLQNDNLIFTIIQSPMVKQVLKQQNQSYHCAVNMENKTIISIEKVSESHVLSCYESEDGSRCEIINIQCETVRNFNNLSLNETIRWKNIENPFTPSQFQLQFWSSQDQNSSHSESLILDNQISFLHNMSSEKNKYHSRFLEEQVSNTTITNALQNYSKILEDINNFFESQFAFNQSEEWVERMIDEWESIFMPPEAYHNYDLYQYVRGGKLLESKLKPLLDGFGSKEEQEQNCKLVTKKIENFDIPVGIKFGKKKDWKFCRVAVNIKFENFVLAPEPDSNQSSPYKIYKCGMSFSNMKENCRYQERMLHNRIYLSSKHLNILIIENMGYTYDLVIKDINEEEMERVTEIFFYMLLITIFTIFGFFMFILFRSVCFYLLILSGIRSDQPNYNFPLNYFELKIRIKKMKDSNLIIERGPLQGEEGDDCVFCLESKMQVTTSLIELYCHHSFHSACFVDWIRQESRIDSAGCPICKRKITRMGYRRYQQSLNREFSNESQLNFE